MKPYPNTPSGPRRTRCCNRSARACGFPPAPGAPGARAETRTSSPGNRLRKSAPKSTEPPSAPPGPAPSVSPTAAAVHSLSVCRRAALVAGDRSCGVDRAGVPQSAIALLPLDSRSVRSSSRPRPPRRGYGTRTPRPLPARLSYRSGRTVRKTGIVVPAWPFGRASVSAERLSPAVRLHAQFPLALQHADRLP